MANVTVVDHPLVQHKLTIMRDKLLTYRDRVQAGEDPASVSR